MWKALIRAGSSSASRYELEKVGPAGEKAEEKVESELREYDATTSILISPFPDFFDEKSAFVVIVDVIILVAVVSVVVVVSADSLMTRLFSIRRDLWDVIQDAKTGDDDDDDDDGDDDVFADVDEEDSEREDATDSAKLIRLLSAETCAVCDVVSISWSAVRDSRSVLTVEILPWEASTLTSFATS